MAQSRKRIANRIIILVLVFSVSPAMAIDYCPKKPTRNECKLAATQDEVKQMRDPSYERQIWFRNCEAISFYNGFMITLGCYNVTDDTVFEKYAYCDTIDE